MSSLCSRQVCTLVEQPELHALSLIRNIQRGEHRRNTMPVPTRVCRAKRRSMCYLWRRPIQIEQYVHNVSGWNKLSRRLKRISELHLQGRLLWLFRRCHL